jgi:hypothetical protein
MSSCNNHGSYSVTKKCLFLWFIITFFNGPASILLHEGGHYIGAAIAGYSNSELHYASFTRGTPLNGKEQNKLRAITSSGGPIVTLIIAIVSVAGVFLTKSNSFFISLGLVSTFRNLKCIIIIFSIIFTGEMPRNDEVKLAEFLDIPPILPLAISSLVFIGSWAYLISRTKNWKIVFSIILGGTFGITIWLKLIGPLLLP